MQGRRESGASRRRPLVAGTLTILVLGVTLGLVSTIAFVNHDRVQLRSRAVFAMSRELGWPWRMLALFSWLPLSLTDAVYRLIARSRYGIFGKLDACRIPTAEERALFLP